MLSRDRADGFPISRAHVHIVRRVNRGTIVKKKTAFPRRDDTYTRIM